MKPLLLVFIFLLNHFLNAQITSSQSNYLEWFYEIPSKYLTRIDIQLIDKKTGEKIPDNVVSKGTCFSPSYWSYFWKGGYDYQKVKTYFMNYETQQIAGYILADDIILADSENLPINIISNYNSPDIFFWIPEYSINIINSKERDTIFIYEPKRSKNYEESSVWHDADPYPITFRFTNLEISFPRCTWGTGLVIKRIEQENNIIKLILSTPVYVLPNNSLYDYTNINYYPQQYPNKLITLSMELQGKRMRLYNGENNKLMFDLIQVSKDFYDKYVQFIRTNTVPKDLVIPTEFLVPWKEDLSQQASQDTASQTYRTTTNLRVRLKPSTNAEILDTLPKGTEVEILTKGEAVRIDGISSFWVFVKTKEGRIGWSFGGYLDPKP